MDVYSIGDVARFLDISVSTVRLWTNTPEFRVFLSATATKRGKESDGKWRQYTRRDVDVLHTIQRLKDQRYTDEGIMYELEKGTLHPAEESAEISLKRRIAALEAELEASDKILSEAIQDAIRDRRRHEVLTITLESRLKKLEEELRECQAGEP